MLLFTDHEPNTHAVSLHLNSYTSVNVFRNLPMGGGFSGKLSTRNKFVGNNIDKKIIESDNKYP